MKRGFTLVEILVAISIISVLTAVIGGNFVTSRVRARDAERKNALNQIARTLELFYNDYGRYPSDLDGELETGIMVACDPTPAAAPDGEEEAVACTWGQAFQDVNGSIYMTQLPLDSRAPSYTYYYDASPDQTKYRLFAHLENDEDIDVISGRSESCGAAFCNYGIPSSSTTMDEAFE